MYINVDGEEGKEEAPRKGYEFKKAYSFAQCLV